MKEKKKNLTPAQIKGQLKKAGLGAKSIKRITPAQVKAEAKAAAEAEKAKRKLTLTEKLAQLKGPDRRQLKNIFKKLGGHSKVVADRRGADEARRAGVILIKKLGAKRPTKGIDFTGAIRYVKVDENDPKSKWLLYQDRFTDGKEYDYKAVRKIAFNLKKERYIREIAGVTGHKTKFIKDLIKEVRADEKARLKKFKRTAAFKKLSAKKKRQYTIKRGTWAILRTMADLLQIVGTDPKGAR